MTETTVCETLKNALRDLQAEYAVELDLRDRHQKAFGRLHQYDRAAERITRAIELLGERND